MPKLMPTRLPQKRLMPITAVSPTLQDEQDEPEGRVDVHHRPEHVRVHRVVLGQRVSRLEDPALALLLLSVPPAQRHQLPPDVVFGQPEGHARLQNDDDERVDRGPAVRWPRREARESRTGPAGIYCLLDDDSDEHVGEDRDGVDEDVQHADDRVRRQA